MTEPASSGVAAFSAGKFALSSGIGVGLAAFIVMIFTRPRTTVEWVQACICTGVASLGGGAFCIVQFQLLEKIQPDYLGMLALGGVFVACGLPGWMLVRWIFNWLNKNRDSDIQEMAEKTMDAIKKVRP